METIIINLPNEIKTKISSYLYFPHDYYSDFKQVLYIIKNHKELLKEELLIRFVDRLEILNYRMLKFFILPKNYFLCEKVEMNYKLDFDVNNNLDQINYVLDNLNMIECYKLYNYIMFSKHVL